MIKIIRRTDEPFSSSHKTNMPVSTWPSFSRPRRLPPRAGNHGHRTRCHFCQRRPFYHTRNCKRHDAIPSNS